MAEGPRIAVHAMIGAGQVAFRVWRGGCYAQRCLFLDLDLNWNQVRSPGVGPFGGACTDMVLQNPSSLLLRLQDSRHESLGLKAFPDLAYSKNLPCF